MAIQSKSAITAIAAITPSPISISSLTRSRYAFGSRSTMGCIKTSGTTPALTSAVPDRHDTEESAEMIAAKIATSWGRGKGAWVSLITIADR